MKDKDVISSPHDRFFKSVLSEKDSVIQLIKSYVPKEICEHLDFESLEAVPISFIDNELNQRESDVIYQANFRGRRRGLD